MTPCCHPIPWYIYQGQRGKELNTMTSDLCDVLALWGDSRVDWARVGGVGGRSLPVSRCLTFPCPLPVNALGMKKNDMTQ